MSDFSIALFGSALRSDFDSYSDKDLLIVSDNTAQLNKLSDEYKKLGFSVSTYTYRKLSYLSKIGSLFIQHLKKESSILIDKNENLKRILAEHLDVKPTQKSINRAVRYFDYFDTVPDSPLGFGWFIDCIYVGLRNYLININALRGDYRFSFPNLIENEFVLGKVTKEEKSILLKLRIEKASYRNKSLNSLPDRAFIESIFGVLCSLGFKNDYKLVPPRKAYEDFYPVLLKRSVNYYFKMRYFELLFKLNGLQNERVMSIIENPQCYSFMFRNQENMKELLDALKLKQYSSVF